MGAMKIPARHDEQAAAEFTWRRIAVPAYGPTILASMATGIVIPVAAIRADQLGASLGTAALVVSLLGLGQLLGALPAGAIVARIGERATLARAALLDVAAMLVAGWVDSLWLMAAAVLAAGFASAAFFLARQGYMIDVVPPNRIARGMSLLGGAHRAGLLLGPAVGTLVIPLAGVRGAYTTAAVLAGLSFLVVVLSPDLTAEAERGRQGEDIAGLLTVARTHARLLLTLGVGVAVISGLRAARLVILPLWALHLGLDGVQASQIFVASGLLELVVVYPGGWMMDRLGRLAVTVPLMLVLSVAFLLLPLANDTATLIAVALVMAIGNGLGSGIVMTLGADNAPPIGRAQFLGAWRLCGELGNAGGTLGLTAVTAVVSLPAAAVTLGVIGLLGLGWMGHWVARADRLRGATRAVDQPDADWTDKA